MSLKLLNLQVFLKKQALRDCFKSLSARRNPNAGGSVLNIHDRPNEDFNNADRLLKQSLIGPISFENHSNSLAIMGPSGSGKTTLAKSILALHAPFLISGEIYYEGQCLQKDHRTLIAATKRSFGFIPQQAAPWPHLSVQQALTLASSLKSKDRESSLALAEHCGLKRLLHHKPHQLSGGQKQRLLIACALAAKPRLLIFDEAFFALDIVAKMELINLIKSLQQEWRFMAIFITHDVAEALAVADYILLISDGLKIWHGPKDRLKEAPFLPSWNPLLSPLLGADRLLKQSSKPNLVLNG